MALANTTIITDDTNQAQHQELLNWFGSQAILMVIVGDSADAKEGTEIASDFSEDSFEGFSRHVLQITNPGALTDQSVEEFQNVGLITDRADLEDVKAACVGINPRKSYSRVHKYGSLDEVKITELYHEAESNSQKTDNL